MESSADALRLTLTLLPYRDRSSPATLRTGRGHLTNPPGRAKPSCPSNLSDRRPLPGAVPAGPLVHGDLRPPSELPTRRDRSFPAMEFDWLAWGQIRFHSWRPPAVWHTCEGQGGPSRINGRPGHRAMPDFIPPRWCGIRPQPGPSVCRLGRVLLFVSKQKTLPVFCQDTKRTSSSDGHYPRRSSCMNRSLLTDAREIPIRHRHQWWASNRL